MPRSGFPESLFATKPAVTSQLRYSGMHIDPDMFGAICSSRKKNLYAIKDAEAIGISFANQNIAYDFPPGMMKAGRRFVSDVAIVTTICVGQ